MKGSNIVLVPDYYYISQIIMLGYQLIKFIIWIQGNKTQL